MKKLTAIVVLLCLMLCLCSCDELDEMKRAHGTHNDDGTITLMDNTYIKIENLGLDFIVYNKEKLWLHNDDYAEDVYITQKDVPVLLSQFFHMESSLSSNHEILNNGYPGYYLRKDVFDKLKAHYSRGVNYEKYAYVNDTRYILTDQQYALLENTLKTEQALKYNSSTYYGDKISVYQGTDDGYFGVVKYVIHDTEDSYYISDSNYQNIYKLSGDALRLATQIFENHQ